MKPWFIPEARGRGAIRLLLFAAVSVWFVLACSFALAVEPDEMLADPALEARAREIGRELRCLVCQNQSIDDSAAPLAKDLRVLLRQRLKAGDTDEQAVQFIVDRYGEFVLLKPPFDPATWALWLGAPALLIAGAAALVWQRRRPHEAAKPLTEAERRRLDELLK
jgi:cytochrome c-type biogenesis protein CcmH